MSLQPFESDPHEDGCGRQQWADGHDPEDRLLRRLRHQKQMETSRRDYSAPTSERVLRRWERDVSRREDLADQRAADLDRRESAMDERERLVTGLQEQAAWVNEGQERTAAELRRWERRLGLYAVVMVLAGVWGVLAVWPR